LEQRQPISHATILIAPPEEGYSAGCRLAQTMLCTGAEGTRPCGLCRNCRKAEKGIHPDILTVERPLDDKGKQKREIYVEQVRDIVADAAVLPNEADRKVYIIRDADTMNASAQNALLKILEEPPAFVAFVLIAASAAGLLETVRSRCALRYCGGEEEQPGPEARARAEQYLQYAAAGAKVSLISFANLNADLGNADFLEFVRACRLLLTDMLCGRLPAMKLPKAELLRLAGLMDTAEEYLRFNVSTKHVLGLLTVDTVVKPNKP